MIGVVFLDRDLMLFELWTLEACHPEPWETDIVLLGRTKEDGGRRRWELTILRNF